VRNNTRNENLASTTVSDMKAVAHDMLRMGKHWTQAAQDWLDQRRDDVRDDDRRTRSTRRRPRDMQSDYGSGGYDQVDSAYGGGSRPYGAYGARGYRGVGPRNYNRSDDRIREDLNERLTEADDLDASDLTVEVSNGIATLGGSVDHRWMKHRAEDLADACIGVKDVRNNIQVRNGGRSTTQGGMHASGSVRAGSSEVSGSLHTNVGNSAGGTSPDATRTAGSAGTATGTSTGTGTNTYQDTASGRPDAAR
jgi:hypothetical protein